MIVGCQWRRESNKYIPPIHSSSARAPAFTGGAGATRTSIHPSTIDARVLVFVYMSYASQSHA
eukprot:202185-Lingulodinium_polyedra.AAC.1